MPRSAGLWAGVVFGGAAVGAVVATGLFVSNFHPVTHDDVCVVTDAQGDTWARTAEQTNNAALVAAVGARRGLGTFGSTVGIATAMQESGLRNLDYGDRDSLGLFQQRPSQGWGTVEEVSDPHHAALAFYWALKKIDGWEDMRVTDAAQTVQRSGFPEAYEKHAPEATAWAQAFRGDTPFAAVTCDLSAVETASSAKAFTARLMADWGKKPYAVQVLGVNAHAVLLGITAPDGDDADLDAIANWSVGVAYDEAVASVRYGDAHWVREQGVGQPTAPVDFDGVLVGVVTAIGD